MDERPDPPAPADPPANGGTARPDTDDRDERDDGDGPDEPLAEAPPAKAPPAGPPPTTELPPPSYPPPDDLPPEPEAGREAGPHAAGAGDDRWHLRRSVGDRKLKGVAGGVAAAAGIDPTLVRILFVVAALSGWGLVAYLVLAIVLQDETVDDRARPLPRDQRRLLRIGLAVAAVLAAGRLFDGWFLTGGGMGLPFVLIAAGAAVLWARREQGASPAPTVGAGGPGVAGAAGGPGGAAAFDGTTEPGWVPPPWPAGPPTPPLGSERDWRSTGRDLLRLAAAFVAVLAFLALVGGGFLVAVGAVPMRVPFLPAAVGLLGLAGLVAGAVGKVRPSGLLISGGVLVAAATLAVGLSSFPGGAGDRIVAIGPENPLRDRYEQGAGRLVLDLAELSVDQAGERRVVAKVGAGQLTVIVPPSLTTNVTAHVGAGNAVLFGREQNGAGVTFTGSQAGDEGSGRLVLDLHVGVGQISVERPIAPTFDVTCKVPLEAKGDGSDPVSCPHPERLAGQPMACSVLLFSPGGRLGKAFCRQGGTFVPAVGRMAVDCTVPGDSDVATCRPLGPALQAELAGFNASLNPVEPPAPAAPPVPAGPGALTCGPPDPAGFRQCTDAPTSTTAAPATTAAPQQYRCTEDPVTKQLSCTPSN